MKQQEALHETNNLPPAGTDPIDAPQNPTYYAWENPETVEETKKPIHKFPYDFSLGTSEYREKFVPFDAENTYHPKPAKHDDVSSFEKIFGDSNINELKLMNSSISQKDFHPFTREEVLNSRGHSFKDTFNADQPTQFAWPLVDGPLPSSPKRVPRPIVGKKDSETHDKFKWPKDYHQDHEDFKNKKTFQSTFSLSSNGSDVSDWQSEYDARCQELREKMKKLSINRQNVNIEDLPPAGISTKNLKTSTNFIWDADEEESLPPPPPPQSNLITSVSSEHFTTENQDKFINWGTKIDYLENKPKVLPHSQTFSIFPKEAPTEDIYKKSEYKNKFNEHTSNINELHANDDIQFKSEVVESKAPPQFAWDLSSSQNGNKDTIKKSDTDSLICTAPFEGTTEYSDKFKDVSDNDHLLLPPPAGKPTGINLASNSTNNEILTHEIIDVHPDFKKSKEHHEEQIAGISSKKNFNVPVNFAWSMDKEQEEKKEIPSEKVKFKLKRVPIEDSESHDKFKFYNTDQILDAVESSLAIRNKMKQSSNASDILFNKSVESENLPEKNEEKVASTEVIYKPKEPEKINPPNFAWSLIEDEDELPLPTPPPSHKFKGATEYDSNFTPQHSALALDLTNKEKPVPIASIDHLSPSEEEQKNYHKLAHTWMSEYDSQNLKLSKSIEKIGSTTPTRTRSGSKSSSAPNYFAWFDTNDENKTQKKKFYKSNPPYIVSPNVSEFKTEYDASYKAPPKIPQVETVSYKENANKATLIGTNLEKNFDENKGTTSKLNHSNKSLFNSTESSQNLSRSSTPINRISASFKDSLAPSTSTKFQLRNYENTLKKSQSTQFALCFGDKLNNSDNFTTETRSQYVWHEIPPPAPATSPVNSISTKKKQKQEKVPIYNKKTISSNLKEKHGEDNLASNFDDTYNSSRYTSTAMSQDSLNKEDLVEKKKISTSASTSTSTPSRPSSAPHLRHSTSTSSFISPNNISSTKIHDLNNTTQLNTRKKIDNDLSEKSITRSTPHQHTSSFNPILMNPRYPHATDRNYRKHWVTETSASYRKRKTKY